MICRNIVIAVDSLRNLLTVTSTLNGTLLAMEWNIFKAYVP